MITAKIECDKIKAGLPASVGLMIELDAPKAITAETLQRAAKGIVFVVDRSGSMGGGRLEIVKQTILDILGRLDKNDYLSVVAFDNAVRVTVPMIRVGELNLADTRKLIADLQPGGNTNLEAGYRAGLAECASAPDGIETKLVLLSDGEANAGVTDPALLGQLAAAATEHLVTTSTIGIGQGYDEKILSELANAGGNHIAAINLDEAVLGMNGEIEGLLGVTMRDVELEVLYLPLQKGFKVKPVQYVRECKNSVEIAKIKLGDFGSEEQRNFLFELELGKVSANPKVKQLSVRATWVDSQGVRKVSSIEPFMLETVSSDNWIEPQRNEDIVAEMAIFRAAQIQEQAIELMRAGRVAEARALMAQIGQELQELEQTSEFMSPRNRARTSAYISEMNFNASIDDADEFIKRGTETRKRMSESKPDPRKPKPNDGI